MISFHNRVLVLAVTLGLIMLATANMWGVLETSEARYAEISREMYRSGDWSNPTLLSIYHYHKPPLTYWLTATAISVFGANAFAVRFFLVVTFCIQIVLVFRISRLLFENEEQSWYASLIYATLPIVLISARGLTTDAFLATFVLLSIYSWMRFRKSGNALSLYLFSVALGLAFFAKGPPALVVPGFVILAFWNFFPENRVRFYHRILAIVLFLVISFGWFVYVIIDDNQLLDYFVFRHFVDRVAHAEVFIRSKPWYYYLPIIPLITIPWIAVFVKGLFSKAKEVPMNANLIRRIGLGWILLPLMIFSISSSKLVLYIVPLFTGFTFITAGYLVRTISKGTVYTVFGINLMVYLSLIIAPVFLPDFHTPWWVMLLPITAILASIYSAFKSRANERAVATLSIIFAINLILFSSFFLHFNSVQLNGVVPLSTFIKKNNMMDRNIIVYDELLPSLAFELDRQIISVYAGNKSLQRETQFEKSEAWKKYLIDITGLPGKDRIKQLVAAKSILVVRTKKISKMKVALDNSWQSHDFGTWTLFFN